jgi:hypothetical protein
MSASPVIDPVRGPDIIDHLKSSERLMTARELASILAISPKTIYAFSATERRKSGPTGSLTAGEERLLGDLGPLRDHSLSPLTMRVMPFLIRTTLKLMSSPRRLSVSFR